jgi:uncharacterized membrane protein YkoI
MRFSPTILTLAVLVTGLCCADAASAGEQYAPQQLLLAQNNGMTLDQAVEQVRRQYGGRIVSAETRRSGDREVHHIKVLTADGKVKSVQVPGRTLKNG